MSTLVYVHGTNGSGKSTLARAVIAAAGGVTEVDDVPHTTGRSKVTWTRKRVALMGRYGNACGGLDGVQPYADTHYLMQHARTCDALSVFAESLVTPGLQTCKEFAEYFDRTVFILLDTPETVCIENVLLRRRAKGNSKPYDPKNLQKKLRSAQAWADNLERAGLQVRRLQYKQAYSLTLQLLGLPKPSVADLLL